MKINNIYKFANLFLKLANTMSIDDAAKLLKVTLNATPEEIAKAYKLKVLENHPDRGGSEEVMKKINEAKEVLSSIPSNKLPKKTPITEDPWVYAAKDGREPTYEEIAEYRRYIGPEEFRKEFPEVEMELKGELGLDAWNKIFEGYDPNYNPEDDPYYQSQQEAKEEWAADKIRDSLDLESLENKLESMSPEEKLNLVINRNNPEVIEAALPKETSSALVVDENRGLSKFFNDYELQKIKNNILSEAVQELIKWNKDLFKGLVSLKQIVESPNKFLILYNPEEHLTLDQINELLTDDFIDFIKENRKKHFSHFSTSLKEKYDFNNLPLERQCVILGGFLADYYKSLGNNTYNNMMFNDIFKEIKNKNIFIFNKLLRAANPANYIGL